MKKFIIIFSFLCCIINTYATEGNLIKNTVLWIIEDQQGKEYVASQLFIQPSHILSVDYWKDKKIPEEYRKEGIEVVLKIKVANGVILFPIEKYIEKDVEINRKYYPSKFPVLVEKGFELKKKKENGKTIVDLR